MTLPAKIPIAEECRVCARTFDNKSNLNRHNASIHKEDNKDKKKDTKTVIACNSLTKIYKYGLHIHTLNTVLWNIVLHLFETKKLSMG